VGPRVGLGVVAKIVAPTSAGNRVSVVQSVIRYCTDLSRLSSVQIRNVTAVLTLSVRGNNFSEVLLSYICTKK